MGNQQNENTDGKWTYSLMLNFSCNNQIQLKLEWDMISFPPETGKFRKPNTQNPGKNLKQQKL